MKLIPREIARRMQEYKVKIVVKSGTIMSGNTFTAICTKRRVGNFTPDSLLSSLKAEDPGLTGILTRPHDLSGGLGGSFDLPEGDYVLVLAKSGEPLQYAHHRIRTRRNRLCITSKHLLAPRYKFFMGGRENVDLLDCTHIALNM